MTPEQQQQFNAELQMVIAVAAQIYSHHDSDVTTIVHVAINLIKTSEVLLKEFYEQPKTPTPEARTEPPVQAPLQPRPTRKVIEDSITAASQVIIAKKLKSQDELLAMLGAYGVKNKSQLNDEQAVKLLEQLKAILK